MTHPTPLFLLSPATPSACSLNSGHSPSVQFACPTVCVASSYSSFKTLAPIPFLQAAISDLLRRPSLWDSVAPDLSLSGPHLTTWHPVLLSTVTRFRHLPGYYTLPGLCICYSLPRMLFLVFFTRRTPAFSRPTTNASPPRGPHSSPRPPLGSVASIPPSSPHLTHGTGRSVCPLSLRCHLWGPGITRVGTRYRGAIFESVLNKSLSV